MWVPINSENRSGSCSENCGFRTAQVVRCQSENGILIPRISFWIPRVAPRIPQNSPRAPRMAFSLRERFSWNWGGPQTSEVGGIVFWGAYQKKGLVVGDLAKGQAQRMEGDSTPQWEVQSFSAVAVTPEPRHHLLCQGTTKVCATIAWQSSASEQGWRVSLYRHPECRSSGWRSPLFKCPLYSEGLQTVVSKPWFEIAGWAG